MRQMKDSGIEWVGEIPENWNIKKGKFIFKQRNSRGNDIELQLLSPTQKYGVIPQSMYEQLSGMKAVKLDESTDFALLKTVHKGDYCISLRSFQGGFEFSEYDGVVSPAYQVFYPVTSVDRRYFKYMFKDKSFIDKMNSYTMSLRDGKNIAYSDFADSYLPIPPIQIQSKIAAALDKKCTEIDNAIAKTTASIEEYKKLKQSIITKAVTKGIRGNRPMKDSGIEWIGEMPVDWKCKKAKYCVKITNGSDPVTEGDIPVYGSGADSFKTCGEYKVGPAVLIGRKGATLHIPHYIEGKYWNVDTAFDVKARKQYWLKYYYYCACSFDYKFYISQTTLPGMTQTNYGNMVLPFSIYAEQHEIAEYLDSKCMEIDKIIGRKQQLITELEAYKKSLIYEYVTGKKEVV